MVGKIHRGWYGVWILTALTTSIIAIITQLPAYWLASYLTQRNAPIQLVAAQGSLWRGQAHIALQLPRQMQPSMPIMLISWRITFTPLSLTTLPTAMLHIRSPLLPNDISIKAGIQSNTVMLDWQATTLTIPATQLAYLGAPFNTLKPFGQLLIQIPTGRIEDVNQLFRQPLAQPLQITVDWLNAGAQITTVQPLGDYRATLTMQANQLMLNIATLRGVLNLEAQGATSSTGFHLTGTVTPQAEVRENLQSLLVLLGRQQGEQTILNY